VIFISQFLSDPAGIIYNASTMDIIEGATVTLYKEQGGDWILWPAEQFSQTNPLVSDPDGYAWLTDYGDFKVKATKSGFTDGWGGPVTVPPEVTDLHIYLTSTTLTTPAVSDLYVSDFHGWQDSEYFGGEEVQARITVTNTQQTDAQVDVVWTTTDPQGRVVPTLSGSDIYHIGTFGVDLQIRGTIPATTPEGWHTLRVEISQAGQTKFRGTQFLVHDAAATIYSPVIIANAAGSSAPTPPPDWVNIMAEDFEAAWPSTGWELYDGSDLDGGDFRPGKRNCRPYEGSYSLWMVGGGADGSAAGCGTHYPHYVDSWAIYGPFSLADATAAELNFQLWLNSETDYDVFYACASLDNIDFYCLTDDGDTQGWVARSLDLANTPTLGNLLGQSQVWITLIFDSDFSTNYPEGAYVDNVVLRKRTASIQSMLAGPRPVVGASTEPDPGITRSRPYPPSQSHRRRDR
jgi:hypothetical protein